MGMTRSDVLRKCIIVFDAIRRAASKGNAGLEPLKGAEESFRTDCEICDSLREMLREMQSVEMKEQALKDWKKLAEELQDYEAFKNADMKDWQRVVMENGAPERLDFDEVDKP